MGELNCASWIGWLKYDCASTLGRNYVFGHGVTPEPSGFYLRHESLTDKAHISLTPFAEVMARKNALSIDNHLSSAYSKGSKGGMHTASNTRGRSHRGAFGAQEGCNLRVTLKKCKEGRLMTGKEVSHLEGTLLRYQTGSGLSMSEGLETPAACNHADFLRELSTCPRGEDRL